MDTTNGAEGSQPTPDENARHTGDVAATGSEATTPAWSNTDPQVAPHSQTAPYPQTAPTEPIAPVDNAPTEPIAPAADMPAEPATPGQYPGQSYQGQVYPAPSSAEQPYDAQAYQAQQFADQQRAAQAYAAQQYAQQYQGQQYAGGQYAGQQPYVAAPYGGQQYMWAPMPSAADTKKRRRRAIALACGAFATAALFGIGTSIGIAGATGAFGQSSSNASSAQPAGNGPSTSGGSGGTSVGGGTYGFGGSGSGGSSSGSGSTGSLPSASSAEEIGVVDIVSQLTYDNAESAGTGLVLTSNGEILTNNHVVEGSTSVSVTIVSTGKTYTATVVGTDATDDVAVLKLSNVSGLATAKLSSSTVSVGDSVTGVGNAGGTGGTPSASAGKVVATNQSITTQAEESAVSESLTGLIETNADIQAGDSGGPLYNSSNQVVGIDTAASSGGTAVQGYAIPIATALSIAKQIESGNASATVSIGYPPFLGVEVETSGSDSSGGTAGGFTNGGGQTTSGATVGQVIADTPADSAGIVAGDVITAVNGTTITSASDLTAALKAFKPGDTVTITWVDSTGASQSASVTLTTGPVA